MVIRFVSFLWGVQLLCATMILNSYHNVAHDVDLSDLGGYAMPVPVPVLLQGMNSAQSSVSTSYVWTWTTLFLLGVLISVLTWVPWILSLNSFSRSSLCLLPSWQRVQVHFFCQPVFLQFWGWILCESFSCLVPPCRGLGSTFLLQLVPLGPCGWTLLECSLCLLYCHRGFSSLYWGVFVTPAAFLQSSYSVSYIGSDFNDRCQDIHLMFWVFQVQTEWNLLWSPFFFLYGSQYDLHFLLASWPALICSRAAFIMA
jgi:hypothetical protein